MSPGTKVLSWMTRGISVESGIESISRIQRPLTRVDQQVARGHAGIDVETGNAIGMVVIEHQPAALLVGIVKSRRPAGRNRHVGDILKAHALRVGSRLPGRGYPLMGRPIADPRSEAAMEMEGGAVLSVILSTPEGTCPCPHVGRVHGDEEVARSTQGEQVVNLTRTGLFWLARIVGPR